jgi:uncharacterized protein YlxW (UPF0749 family)
MQIDNNVQWLRDDLKQLSQQVEELKQQVQKYQESQITACSSKRLVITDRIVKLERNQYIAGLVGAVLGFVLGVVTTQVIEIFFR